MTVVLYNVALVIAGEFGPLTSVHNPVAGDGSFPARVIVDWLHRFCAGPAFDDTGVLTITAAGFEVAVPQPLPLADTRTW